MFCIKNTNESAPFYATPMSAGFDICANEDAQLEPGDIKAVATGLYVVGVNIPEDATQEGVMPELQIRSRSGLALNGVVVAQGVGTIDADYRFPNEIKVILMNCGGKRFTVKKGDRIAQGVVSITVRAIGVEVLSNPRTGGFGSTGGN
jgi:dUTP pyrophosphatase